ncbi:hypothetical protein EVAR_42712_1 [Eumeta japonica]|uniref:Uncharacterized protein n=1 Tax=Eumeta variegata TaxID=151549 RepID=A0A4C1WYG7_EUMVA|nr:hypothetical protein EVAR_42712_1 [Eumeta japonica]
MGPCAPPPSGLDGFRPKSECNGKSFPRATARANEHRQAAGRRRRPTVPCFSLSDGTIKSVGSRGRMYEPAYAGGARAAPCPLRTFNYDGASIILRCAQHTVLARPRPKVTRALHQLVGRPVPGRPTLRRPVRGRHSRPPLTPRLSVLGRADSPRVPWDTQSISVDTRIHSRGACLACWRSHDWLATRSKSGSHQLRVPDLSSLWSYHAYSWARVTSTRPSERAVRTLL